MDERGSIQGGMNGWKNSAFMRFLLFLLLGVVLYAALMEKVVPQTYDIQLGTQAERDILAPKAVPDEEATSRAKEEAAAAVQPVYKVVNLKNDIALAAIFEKLQQINADQEVTQADKVSIYKTVIPSILQEHYEQLAGSLTRSGQYHETLTSEMLDRLNEQVYRIPEETYYKLPRVSADDLTAMEPVAEEIVRKLMNDQLLDAQVARTKVAELVNASTLTKSVSREIVQELVRAAVTPNRFYDQKGTEDERAQAREDVGPIYVNKNDVLVAKGEPITEDVYERLTALNLLKDKTSYWPHIGLAVFTILSCVILLMFVRQSRLSVRHNNAQLMLFLLIIALTIAVMKVFALAQSLEYPFIGYLAPAAMGAMLVAILLDMHLAYAAAVVFSVAASILFNIDYQEPFDYRYALVTLAASFAAIFSINRASQRSSILKAGVLVSLVSALLVVALQLMAEDTQLKDLLFASSFALGSGILTAVFVIGLLPFLEVAFGILSPLKLVELSNPNHPLLRKLLTETPGTYHHSVMVSNLAESAAESIGADGLLCRVGAYYHDLGKTKRPSYFIENQNGMENPHDRIEPALSKSIITAHARDGADMLKEYKIPKPIRDIAEQHHGTTLLAYFYHKARKQAEERGEPLPEEEEFRYPGPKAQSKEAAVVGIADCVEAAVRSLRNPTVEQIDSMVRKIVKSRLDDGQFNDCDLTLKDLEKITRSLNESLLGIFHSRIEYPGDAAASKEQAKPGT